MSSSRWESKLIDLNKGMRRKSLVFHSAIQHGISATMGTCGPPKLRRDSIELGHSRIRRKSSYSADFDRNYEESFGDGMTGLLDRVAWSYLQVEANFRQVLREIQEYTYQSPFLNQMKQMCHCEDLCQSHGAASRHGSSKRRKQACQSGNMKMHANSIVEGTNKHMGAIHLELDRQTEKFKKWCRKAAHQTKCSFRTRMNMPLNDRGTEGRDGRGPAMRPNRPNVMYRRKYTADFSAIPGRSCFKGSRAAHGIRYQTRNVAFSPACEVSEYVIIPYEKEDPPLPKHTKSIAPK